MDFAVGLVVPVQGDVGAGDAGAEGDGEFAAGRRVQAQPLFLDPADHGGAQEGLAGIVDVHSPANIGEGVVERVAERPGPGPEVGLAQHEQRRAVLALQLADRQPLDGELAVVVPRDTARPQRFVEGVEVGGDLEPARRER